MKQFLFELLQLIPLIILPWFFGYDDGRMKKDKTEAHWPKWIVIACTVYLMMYDFVPLLLIGFGMIWKPLFDYGWTRGAGYFGGLYLGGTSWTDRLVKKIIPKAVLPLVYWFFIIGGIFLMHYFQFRY